MNYNNRDNQQSHHTILEGAGQMRESATGFVTEKEAKPVMRRRIGSTTYTVGVHFSEVSRERMEDKILRLVRNEALTNGSIYGKMEVLQMNRLPEGSSL